MIEFATTDGRTGQGYLAVPKSGAGAGVLLLHSWWGFQPVVQDFADELADAGFVIFAPDLWDGRTAATRAEAEALVRNPDFDRLKAVAEGSVDFLSGRPEVTPTGAKLAAVGFSMGASWALRLAQEHPQRFSRVCLFYDEIGVATPDTVRLQTHFGDEDEFAPVADLRAWGEALAAAGRGDDLYLYPGAGHWFMDTDKPEHDRPDAAALAKERLLTFLMAPDC